MKRTYTKPQFEFQSFTPNDSIAACFTATDKIDFTYTYYAENITDYPADLLRKIHLGNHGNNPKENPQSYYHKGEDQKNNDIHHLVYFEKGHGNHPNASV